MTEHYIQPRLDAYQVLLVNLPSDKGHTEFDYQRSVPPLGLGYIATYLENQGIRVGLFDAEFHRLSVDEITAIVKRIAPTFTAVNCYSAGESTCRELLWELQDVGTKVIVGGPHVTAKPLAFVDMPHVISVQGFGERPMHQIVHDGISGRTIHNFLLEQDIVNLHVNQKFFVNRISLHDGLREGVLIASRGCPHTCRYCMSAGSVYQLRTIDSTIRAIADLVSQDGAESIHFLDDMALPTNTHLRQFIHAMQAAGLQGKFTWRGMQAVNALRNIDVPLLKESQCAGLAIGIESGSERLLRLVGKRYQPKDVLPVLEKLKKGGIKLKLFFMLGLPTETTEDIAETAQLIRTVKSFGYADDLNIFQFKPYPGTELFEAYFRDRKIEFLQCDLRHELRGRVVSPQMEKALAKDTYFCRHDMLTMPLEQLQATMIGLYESFYQTGGSHQSSMADPNLNWRDSHG